VIVETTQPGVVGGRRVWTRAAAGEPRLRIDVVHALIREFADVVAGLTQAGASAVHPVLTARAVARPDPARSDRRIERWRAVAAEAAQLAGRVRAPSITAVQPLAEVVSSLATGTRILVCTLDARTPVGKLDIARTQPLALVLGPEGGLDAAEQRLLVDAGGELVHLGPRVHPAKTAGSIAVTLALEAAGDLDEIPPPPPWPD